MNPANLHPKDFSSESEYVQARAQLPIAPAYFIGIQEGCGSHPDFPLYNLTAPIPGHPVGSTVSELTLLGAGYRLPANTPQRAIQHKRQALKDSCNPFFAPLLEDT